MSVKRFSLMVGITIMIYSDLSGIEIIDATASSEDGVLTLSWQVYNDRDEPIYLLNINEPLIEKKQDNLVLLFRMPDPLPPFILREVPFRSRAKRIEGDSTYTFNFRIDPSRLFSTPDLEEALTIGNVDNIENIEVFLGYTDEDISYVYNRDGHFGLTGGEAFKLKSDDGFQNINVFTEEQITALALNNENRINIFEAQKIFQFSVNIE